MEFEVIVGVDGESAGVWLWIGRHDGEMIIVFVVVALAKMDTAVYFIE